VKKYLKYIKNPNLMNDNFSFQLIEEPRKEEKKNRSGLVGDIHAKIISIFSVLNKVLFLFIVFILGYLGIKLGFQSDNQSSGENRIYPSFIHVDDDYAKRIPILSYHHIDKNMDPYQGAEEVVSFEDFKEQIEFLAKEGYKTLTLQEFSDFLKGEKEIPSKSLLITFDDGYESLYQYAYPVLKEHDFTAVAFLITHNISELTRLNLEKELPKIHYIQKVVMKDVFEYGSHTHSLHELDQERQSILLSLEGSKVLKDLTYSRNVLKTLAFSYPYGGYDEHLIDIVKKAGFQLAFTTDPKMANVGDDPFTIGRLSVVSGMPIEDFKELVGYSN
jgi:peptidoglycan/xylan/chitin deacetylase (PgdA/CDA1 family)